MKQSRFNRLISSQSIAAKKVYDAVPIQEDWDSMTINRELYRKGTKLNFTVVEGCLNTLTEAKLIKEVSRGKFKRVPVEAIPDEFDEHEPQEQEPDMADKPTKQLQPTAFDILAALGERVTKMAEELNSLVSDIERAALTVNETSEKEAAELASLRQWKSTLKNLMSE